MFGFTCGVHAASRGPPVQTEVGQCTGRASGTCEHSATVPAAAPGLVLGGPWDHSLVLRRPQAATAQQADGLTSIVCLFEQARAGLMEVTGWGCSVLSPRRPPPAPPVLLSAACGPRVRKRGSRLSLIPPRNAPLLYLK